VTVGEDVLGVLELVVRLPEEVVQGPPASAIAVAHLADVAAPRDSRAWPAVDFAPEVRIRDVAYEKVNMGLAGLLRRLP